MKPCENENGVQFVRVDLDAADGRPDLAKLKTNPDWRTYLYTGDYDLHEAYQARGGGGGQITEAKKEKMNLLNRLNAGIVKVDQSRTGTMGLKHGTLHKDEGSDYAMFQHGDQATYRMNQRLEANAQGEKVASLVRAVATESYEPLGWCRYGSWYVTMNLEEHDKIRKQWGLVKPHTWSEEEDERTKNNKMRTARYTDQPQPTQPVQDREEWRPATKADIREGVIFKNAKVSGWYKVGKLSKKNFECFPCKADGTLIKEKVKFFTFWRSLKNLIIQGSN